MSGWTSRCSIAAALAVGAIAFASNANALTILTFGQVGSGSPITATENVAKTQTTIAGSNIPVTITGIDAALATPIPAFFTLSATSTDAALLVGGVAVLQHYSGTFAITNGATNYLSGTFMDAVFGANGGTSLTLAATSVPPQSVVFSSNVITDLFLPRALALSFANVTPATHIDGTTLAAFTSSVGGTFSAAVPEPSTWAMMLLGFAGLAFAFRQSRRKVSFA
jgi:hypothetical protein